MDEITILDDQIEPVVLFRETTYKLVNPDGQDVGMFAISGTPLVAGEHNGNVFLAGVPHTGQILFVDVNDKAGALTKIANNGTERIHAFNVHHPDIIGENAEHFGQYHSTIVKPKPFTAVWSYYDAVKSVDVEVTVYVKPLPHEHAIEVSFTTSENDA